MLEKFTDCAIICMLNFFQLSSYFFLKQLLIALLNDN